MRGCSVDGGVVVFSPHPLACEKDHIAPQLCQKRRTRKKKGGGCVFAFHSLALGA
uniref:Uncharacterized protein n=1 Tax=Siphoviridae sp. ctkV91 TaxID=2827924 RepID=A0A8S5TDF3_9CAUD|nr:MAG TPA: hypothetical protein [Siphoviridae sp. ctkV91]